MAKVYAFCDQGLLDHQADSLFPDTLRLVQAINHYVGPRLANIWLDWKTNIWGVRDQQNGSLGILHMTDRQRYSQQTEWTGPAADWTAGRRFIATQATRLATFLRNVGVTNWSGTPDKTPFVAIDKHGVDGAFTFDPAFLSPNSQTASFGNLFAFVIGSYGNRQNFSNADSQTYFGLSKDAFVAFCDTYGPLGFPKDQPAIQAAFTALHNAAKADPNMAMWLSNADQWNNYLLFVTTGITNFQAVAMQRVGRGADGLERAVGASEGKDGEAQQTRSERGPGGPK